MGWRRAAADEARQYDKGEDVGQHAQEIRRDVDGRVVVVDRLPKSEYQARDEGAKRRPLAKDHRRERDVASTVRHVGTNVFETPIARNAPARPESSPLEITAL